MSEREHLAVLNRYNRVEIWDSWNAQNKNPGK